MKRQYVRALAQQAVDQVLQGGHATVRMQSLAMNDADAGDPRITGSLQEPTQQRLGLGHVGMVQVEFFLRGVLAARQPCSTRSGTSSRR